MKFKIKFRDSVSFKDSIEFYKKKIMDAEIDLTRKGVSSIANALIGVKEDINAASGFAALRDIVVPVIKKFDTPKSKEILMKIEEMNRMYQRDPTPGSRNDYWMWEKLIKYVYNILLKASGNPSPDVKETKTEDADDDFIVIAKKDGTYHMPKLDRTYPDKNALVEAEGQEILKHIKPEDIKIEDDEDPLYHMCLLLGRLHDAVMEAQDYMTEVNETGKVSSELEEILNDLEAEISKLEFMGEDDPVAALLEEFGEPSYDDEEEVDFEDPDYDL